MIYNLVYFFVFFVISVNCIPNDNVTIQEDPENDDQSPGSPLFLTPFIEQGKLREGRLNALVTPLAGKVKSYAGFLTVNKKYNSNMFFWYFESENDPKSDPTVVWLQGGPGASSLFGIFVEHGPYVVNKHRHVSLRKHAWSKISNIVYFDNPVGTGYSYTENEAGYATNQTRIGSDLYTALIQFLKLFPRIQKNDLFITGESYAGKYVPAFGHAIHVKNKEHPHIHVNLKGLMIGNGFTDPIHMMKYSSYLYQIGLIDKNAKNRIHREELETVRLIKKHYWRAANKLFAHIVGGRDTLYSRYSGLRSTYNYYNTHSGNWYSYIQKFITGNRFRRLVHVGKKRYNDGTEVSKKLYDDMTKSVIHLVADLLNHYRILFYNGQLDVICAYPLTVNYLRNMKWPLSHEYKVAKRHRYVVEGEVAGYYKIVGNLTEVLIRDAGHLVATDQPAWALRLLKDFTHHNISPQSESQSEELPDEEIEVLPAL